MENNKKDIEDIKAEKVKEVFDKTKNSNVMEPPKIKEKTKKSSVIKIIVIVVLVVFFLGVAASITAYFKAMSMLEPLNPQEEDEIVISIPQGFSMGQIADLLEDEGIINNSLVFRLYLKYEHEEVALMAGDYLLSPAMSADEIIEKLKTGDIYIETVWFVIPEGYDIRGMAEYFAKEKILEKEDFLLLAEKPSDSLLQEFPFLLDVPENVDYVLEGYLFPSKYEIKKGSSAEEIISLMLRTFTRFLTEENLSRADNLGMSIHDVVTLASIIEREAASDKEWDLVSSVFHNRLNIGMLLQSCATIQYILGEVKEVLLYEDLEVESPYNTYKHGGLPPGPIASPGNAALEASLYPANTYYYYFVSKADGSGEHYFSATFWEHNANKAKAAQN